MSENITVAKFGSELVANSDGIQYERIGEYVRGLVETHYDGGLIVVTSGAVRAGEARILRIGDRVEDYDKITLAQYGAATMMRAWEEEFENEGIFAGGLLTTHYEMEDSKEGPSLVRALRLVLDKGGVSIVNENDALSNVELMKLTCGGDNDGLAQHTAVRVGARTLKLFTKRGGIVDENDELVGEVNNQNIVQIRSMLQSRTKNKATDGIGRGGMVSKLDAAWHASKQGMQADISAPNQDMTGEKVTRVVVG